MLRSRVGPLLARAGGITTDRTIPPFASRRNLLRELNTADPRAVYFVDTFTRAFRPHLAGAVQRVLAEADLPVTPRTGLCCGLTWITTGQLGVARRVLKRTVKALSSGVHSDLPIVVAEPSCATALRTDLPDLLDTKEAADVAGFDDPGRMAA